MSCSARAGEGVASPRRPASRPPGRRRGACSGSASQRRARRAACRAARRRWRRWRRRCRRPRGGRTSPPCRSTGSPARARSDGCRVTSCTLRTVAVLDVRADDHGGVRAHPGQELAGLVEQLLEHLVGRLEEGEEVGDDPALRRREPGLAVEVVDEEAVAAVGGHPPGRRVGLHEVALALEDGHVVAHRGARHAEVAGARDGLRSHRLSGGDVLLHDRSEDRRLALVELHWHSILPSASRDRRLLHAPRGAARPTSLPRSRPRRVSTTRDPEPCSFEQAGGAEIVEARDHSGRIGRGQRELDPPAVRSARTAASPARAASVRNSSPASAELPAP